jgi:hypothetical protein
MKRVWRVLLATFIFLGLVGMGLYFLLLSPMLAGNAQIIPIRYKYVKISDKFNVLQPVIVAMNDDPDLKGLHWYYIEGKIERADVSTFSLRTRDGEMYRFFIDWKFVDDEWVQHVVKSAKKNEDGFKWAWVTFNIKDIQKSGDQDHTFYDPDQLYGLVWSDTASVAEIMKKHKTSPLEPMNADKKMKYFYKYE